MIPDLSAVKAEEDRVRAAYSRRSGADRYSWFSPGHVFMLQGRERRVLDILRRCGVRDLGHMRIFEVGCGHGQWLADFIKWGAVPSNLAGIDLLADRLAAARTRLPSSVTLYLGSATELPIETESFDIVVQSTVFSSILDENVRRQAAGELLRVLNPNGFLVWYDLFVSNPRNPDVRGVSLRELRRLFASCSVDVRRATLAPPVTRTCARISWLLCELLELLPLLRTHYLGVIRKRS